MKKIILMPLIAMFYTSAFSQNPPSKFQKVIRMTCAVAHGDGKGNVFVCDFNGTYYPAYIQDDKIKKWFIKMDGMDSLFYYRKDIDRIFIWNGRPKNELYGYECKEIGTTMGNPYQGDTLIIKDQIWTPR